MTMTFLSHFTVQKTVIIRNSRKKVPNSDLNLKCFHFLRFFSVLHRHNVKPLPFIKTNCCKK